MKRKILLPHVKAAMQRLKLPLRSYIGHDSRYLYTSEATVEDWNTGAPRRCQVDCGPHAGSNGAGHKLPASSVGKVVAQ